MVSEIKIELTEQGADRLWPECRNVLRTTPSSTTHHEQWGKRAPLGIYTVSLDTLPRRFHAVLDCLDELGTRELPPGPRFQALATRVLDSHQALMYALLEHLEDCANIARVFFPKDESTKKEPLLREILEQLKPYRDTVDRIVNAMKHRQARLGLFQATNSMVTLHGYSVQGLIGPDLIGPHLTVNEPDCTSIDEVVGATAPIELGTDVCTWSFEMASRISKLLPFVYPDEARPPVAVVAAGGDTRSASAGDRGRWIKIELSNSPSIGPLTFGQIPGGPFRLSATFQGDAVTRSFKVP